MPPDLRHFIERSLQALAQEAPVHYAGLCTRLRGRRVRILSDGRPLLLHFAPRYVASMDAEVERAHDVDVRVPRTTLLALLDGHLTLEDALRRDDLYVRGLIADVGDVFDGLMTYVRGGLECPSFPRLLDAYRNAPATEESL